MPRPIRLINGPIIANLQLLLTTAVHDRLSPTFPVSQSSITKCLWNIVGRPIGTVITLKFRDRPMDRSPFGVVMICIECVCIMIKHCRNECRQFNNSSYGHSGRSTSYMILVLQSTSAAICASDVRTSHFATETQCSCRYPYLKTNTKNWVVTAWCISIHTTGHALKDCHLSAESCNKVPTFAYLTLAAMGIRRVNRSHSATRRSMILNACCRSSGKETRSILCCGGGRWELLLPFCTTNTFRISR